MAENIKISINIFPFGQIKFMFSSMEEKPAQKERPIYIVPATTNVEKVEILYRDSKEFIIPETTDWK